MTDHDFYGDDAADRIKPSEWRQPRVIVLDENHSGQFSWGELTSGDCGLVVDTTLVDHVTSVIKSRAISGINAGVVVVDGVEYAFVVGRRRDA